MRRNKRNIFASGLLLTLLAAYAFCITSFTHSHIINGVMIVHSHPFEDDTTHNHTRSQVLTIDQLSLAEILPAEPISFIGKINPPVVTFISDSRSVFTSEREFSFISLRAPPCFS